MGLDIVEIILCTEELFVIHIDDNEAKAVRTVGDLYKLICTELNVTPLESRVTSMRLPTVTEKEKIFLFFYKHTPLPAPPEVLPWSSQSIWDSLVAILADQMALDPKEILSHAHLAEDLGVY